MTDSVQWLLLLVQVPSEPSRHRVAVWRQLRKLGAVPVIPGTWVVPDSPLFTDGINRAAEICRAAGGTFALVAAQARDEPSHDALDGAFRAARLDEWKEFLSDCVKFEQEIDKEIAIEKFTYAELEEEDQSLERLRRWYRDLKKRDVLKLAEADEAAKALQRCTEALEHYARLVYSAGSESDS